MKRVFIYAADQIYEGQHGMESWVVTSVEDDDAAEWIAEEMSRSVITGFDEIMDTIVDNAKSYLTADEADAEDLEIYIDDEIDEDLYWYWYPINEEKCAELTDDQLEALVWDISIDDFIATYCIA